MSVIENCGMSGGNLGTKSKEGQDVCDVCLFICPFSNPARNESVGTKDNRSGDRDYLESPVEDELGSVSLDADFLNNVGIVRGCLLKGRENIG
jgi:hypothetical protein